ncbi:MAG: beta-N-acetylhexosaminidase [Phycisphaera sp.]|nr:beta-N-acetylhexosaminidase [Phycisphaera sp.]
MTERSIQSAARLLCIGFDGPVPTPEARDLVRLGVRSVILFARNAGSRVEVAATIARVKALATDPTDPILVCVDQEGGGTVRFRDGFDPPPSMREVGLGGVDSASEVGTRLAADLRPIGVDLDLAPVVDVDSNPANPVIGSRSFGRDPGEVGRCGAALVQAMQSGGVAACGKHFPGHGDTDSDSHHDLPVLRHGMERLDLVELPPFRAIIEADVASIMTTHVVFEALDPGVPATMSRPAIDGLLRENLGFDGVVVSDDLEMAAIADLPELRGDLGEAAVRAVDAGVDLVLCCHEPTRQRRVIEALAGAIDSGRLGEDRIAAAHRRLDRLFDRFVRP